LLSFEFLFGVELHYQSKLQTSKLDLVWHLDLLRNLERLTADTSVDVLLPQQKLYCKYHGWNVVLQEKMCVRGSSM